MHKPKISEFADEKRLAPYTAKAEEQPIEVAWYFPNTYEIGMSGLGYQLVWWLFEQAEDVKVRRGFTDIAEPGIDDCQLLGFTVSWELDFINILKILKDKGIPVRARDRTAEHPFIFGGGPVLTANPEPFADFFDIILLGDAEAGVPALLEGWRKANAASQNRSEILETLAQTSGIYVPDLYQAIYTHTGGSLASIEPIKPTVAKRVGKQIFSAPEDYVAHTQILSSATAWSDTFLIEVVRSCPQECRFCLASFLTRPFRATSIDTIIAKIEKALHYTKRVGLLGPSVTEHPRFGELAQRLMERKDLEMTIASVRADSLTPTILTMIKNLGQRSVTIAIESGSERLRAVMKKNLSEQEILHAIELIDQSGLDGVKFYGIVGLPEETDEDLEQTVDLMARLKKKHKRLKFVFGVSSFVPKAQTPFQWRGRDRQCQKKLEFIRKNLAKIGIEVRPESHNWSDIQALISRGDRRLCPLLEGIAKTDGNIGAWKRALRNLPDDIPGLDYYVFRDIPTDEVLPWSHLVDSNRSDYLAKHLDSAILAKTAAHPLAASTSEIAHLPIVSKNRPKNIN